MFFGIKINEILLGKMYAPHDNLSIAVTLKTDFTEIFFAVKVQCNSQTVLYHDCGIVGKIIDAVKSNLILQ